MNNGTPREIWVHALGAKVGGGITYLRSLLPELARQLDGRVDRVVVLVPGPIEGIDLPDWFEVIALPRDAASPLSRLIFDQIKLPLRLMRARHAVLFCSGSFSPLVKVVPTVALLRNAIHFDRSFLATEMPRRRRKYLLQGALIGLGARRCKAVMYPTASMRELVEAQVPALSSVGFVNHYGVNTACAGARATNGDKHGASGPPVRKFLYVLNYTRQKNVGYVLEALARARTLGLPVRVVMTSHLTDGPPACRDRDRDIIVTNKLVESGYLELVGPTFGDSLVDLYRSVDACLFPSVCESFGHPLVEAMAAGKPVVCADLSYARELCGSDAIYIDPAEPESLVTIWREWDQLVRDWNPLAIDDVSARFSWSVHVGRLVDRLLGE